MRHRNLLIVLFLMLGLLLVACSSPTAQYNSQSTSGNLITSKSEISWSNASAYTGERVTVVGPVISATYASSSKGRPTFLNIGKGYPDSGRFTVLIWGEDRGNFSSAPEIMYRGETIAVTGLIILYQGVPEIEVTSPSQIQIR